MAKKVRRQVAERLSAKEVENAKPGRHEDGRGLALIVTAAGSKRWTQRIVIQGKRCDLGLGSLEHVSLAEAREAARRNREIARAGGDPLAVKAAEAEAAKPKPTFLDVAREMLATKRAGFRNAKHAAQWQSTLETYAGPVFGRKSVDAITMADVLKALRPIWTAKAETASRVRGRIEAVLDYAKAMGHREAENAARWRGNLDAVLPSPAKVKSVTHQPALPVDRFPAWFAALRQREGMAARCLQFVALTWCRSGEARGAAWAEIDLERAIWTIPAKRTKTGTEHRVPLSGVAMDLLRALPRYENDAFLFPSPTGRVLSDMALSATMRRMQADETERLDRIDREAGRTPPEAPRGWIDVRSGRPAVPHGVRSTARDWAAERGFDDVVAELSLGHRVGSAVERAYRRGDLLDRRRVLLEAWASFITTTEGARVVRLHA